METTPDELDVVGTQALADARGQFPHESTRLEDVALRYAFAVQREHAVRALWFELGQPIVTGEKRHFAHPLVERIEKAEAHAQRLAEMLGLVPGAAKPRPMGRPQERFVPEAGEPPRLAKLRSVS